MFTQIILKQWKVIALAISIAINFFSIKSCGDYKVLFKEAESINKYDKGVIDHYRVINKKVVTEAEALRVSNRSYVESLSKAEKESLKKRGIKPKNIDVLTTFNIKVEDSTIFNYDTTTKYLGKWMIKGFSYVDSDSLLVMSGDLKCDTAFKECNNDIKYQINLKNGQIIVYQYQPKWWKIWDWNLFKGKRERVQATFNSEKVKVTDLKTILMKE